MAPSDMFDLCHDTLLVRDPDFVFVEMDGDLVMMNIENGEYYGVGGIGPRIWELLKQPVTVAYIAAIICGEFEVEESLCRKDVLEFVGHLRGVGLVKPVVLPD